MRALAEGLRKTGWDVTAQELSGSLLQKLLTTLKAAFNPHPLFFTQKFNPLTLFFIIVGRLRGKKVIVDWDDFDPGLQGTVLKRIISYACEGVGPFFPHLITSHSTLILEKVKHLNSLLLPQGYHPDLFYPDKQNKPHYKKMFGLDANKKTIGHLCTFTHGGMLDFETILKTWADIQDPNVQFLLIGGGPLLARVENLLKKYALETKTILTGLLPHSKVPKALNALDEAWVYLSDTKANRSRVSFKTIEYLACGIPIKGKLVGETQKMFGPFVEKEKTDLSPFHWPNITKQLAQKLTNDYK